MIKVGILGVSGYTGLELVKIILNHSDFELSYAGASSEGKIDEIFPQLKGVCDLKVQKADVNEIKSRCDLVFTALPHMESMKYIKELRKSVKIVDLSADYRISYRAYKANYGEHLDKEGLKIAKYIIPEINGENAKKTSLIANPGCYPTASLLALAPFASLINDKNGVFIDAKSGVSGAGKGLKESSHFISVNENANAYSPLTHRHAVEIKEHFENLSGLETQICFVPHLLPLSRGMLATCYFTLSPEFKDTKPLELLKRTYKGHKFIRVCDAPPSIKNIAGTHFCDLYAMKSGDKVVVFSAIDNLLRGASSQAIANANLMCGIDEYTALPRIASFV